MLATSVRAALRAAPLLGLVLTACGTARLEPAPAARRFGFEMRASLAVGDGRTSATIWLPVPIAEEWQELGQVVPTAEGGAPAEHYDDHGNRFLSVTGTPTPDQPLAISYRVEVSRIAATPRDDLVAQGALPDDPTWLTPAKLASLEIVRRQVLYVTAQQPDTVAKARALFGLAIDRVKLVAQGESNAGRGDLYWIWQSGLGDAADAGTLFVACCQSIGIPASIECGFALPTDSNSEWRPLTDRWCWARFFAPGLGWIPVDVGRAIANPERKDRFFDGLDHDRVRVARGHDLLLAPAQQGPPPRFLFGPYAEQAGKDVTAELRSVVRYRDLATERQ